MIDYQTFHQIRQLCDQEHLSVPQIAIPIIATVGARNARDKGCPISWTRFFESSLRSAQGRPSRAAGQRDDVKPSFCLELQVCAGNDNVLVRRGPQQAIVRLREQRPHVVQEN
jgi:hypothetical protein